VLFPRRNRRIVVRRFYSALQTPFIMHCAQCRPARARAGRSRILQLDEQTARGCETFPTPPLMSKKTIRMWHCGTAAAQQSSRSLTRSDLPKTPNLPLESLHTCTIAHLVVDGPLRCMVPTRIVSVQAKFTSVRVCRDKDHYHMKPGYVSWDCGPWKKEGTELT